VPLSIELGHQRAERVRETLGGSAFGDDGISNEPAIDESLMLSMIALTTLTLRPSLRGACARRAADHRLD
jgi:hypothetical protein